MHVMMMRITIILDNNDRTTAIIIITIDIEMRPEDGGFANKEMLLHWSLPHGPQGPSI